METLASILKWVLILAGAIALAVVVLAVLAYIWLRRKVRAFGRSLNELVETAAVPPFRVKLQRVEECAWNEAAAVRERVEELRGLGFRDVGSFEAPEITTALVALVHSDQSAAAVVYEHPKAGVWIDLVTKYADGSTYAVTTAQPDLLERPPGRILRNYPGLHPRDLYQRLVDERPSGTMLSIAPEDFVEWFERAYADDMEWRGRRGGPTEDEVRAIAARDGQEVTPETIDHLRGLWRAAYSEHLNEQLRAEYLHATSLSAAEWEEMRERLIFVHEYLDADGIVALYEWDWPTADDEEQDDDIWDRQTEEIRQLRASRDARSVVEELNARLAPEHRLRKLGDVRQPVAADVYIAPEDQ